MVQSQPDTPPSPPVPMVEIEEDVYSYEPADNGAGPMWCHGSTCLVRHEDALLASGLETLPGLAPLNNVRWLLFRRTEGGWELLRRDETGRTREPCPMACYEDGRAFLSVNPALSPPDAYNGPAEPQILQFAAHDPAAPWRTLLPGWAGTPAFTEHSYRSFAADGPRGEMILFQNIGYTHAEWALCDHTGAWCSQGQLVWPWGVEYDEPQPIRVCYPNVALRDRAVHFCGVSDIVEPYHAWRQAKKEVTGRDWDFDFRRLFYTWCPDITTGAFHDWVEVSSRDRTCGWIFPDDLWLAPDGAAHLLFTERAIDERLRDRFYPEARQSHALNYAVVREGEVVLRRVVAEAEEGQEGDIPGQGRFHPTADGRLLIIHASGEKTGDGEVRTTGNLLVEVSADGSVGPPARLDLEAPLASFFTATPRAGSRPSPFLDLLGEAPSKPGAVRYVRIGLKPVGDRP